tara:strand:+ start:2028 stop:2534 length:507 start_codon:yes stop_codon:yes gene_type:complete
MGGTAKQKAAPKATTGTPATKKENLDAMVFNKIQEASRANETMTFTGFALYTTEIKFKDFQKRFDQDFIEAVTQGNDMEPNATIFEVIVYVEEICAPLPQPTRTGIDLLNTPGEKKSKQKSDIAMTLKRISRFPKGYKRKIDGTKPGKLTTVQIEFDREYDYSHGIIK